MKHEKTAPWQEQIKTVSVAVSLALTIGGVAVGVINYLSIAQLQPFGYRLAIIEKAQAEGDKQRDTLATKAQVDSLMNMVDGRLKSMESKIDFIYQQKFK